MQSSQSPCYCFTSNYGTPTDDVCFVSFPPAGNLQALSLFGDAAVCNFPADEQVEVEGIGADGMTVKVRTETQLLPPVPYGINAFYKHLLSYSLSTPYRTFSRVVFASCGGCLCLISKNSRGREKLSLVFGFVPVLPNSTITPMSITYCDQRARCPFMLVFRGCCELWPDRESSGAFISGGPRCNGATKSVT